MNVPDLLVALILVFNGDEACDFFQSEVGVAPKILDGSPHLVLGLIQ